MIWRGFPGGVQGNVALHCGLHQEKGFQNWENWLTPTPNQRKEGDFGITEKNSYAKVDQHQESKIHSKKAACSFSIQEQ